MIGPMLLLLPLSSLFAAGAVGSADDALRVPSAGVPGVFALTSVATVCVDGGATTGGVAAKLPADRSGLQTAQVPDAIVKQLRHKPV